LQALNLILEITTSILIVHRLSPIKSADKILVMENSGIIEEGNHDNLLAQKEHYVELYNTYFVIDHTPPLKYRSRRRRPRRRASHKPPLGTAARAEGCDQFPYFRHQSLAYVERQGKVIRE